MPPWAPKITPTWSLKWSQGNSGRPSRNLHRHGPIAFPPLGRSFFVYVVRTQSKHRKILHGNTEKTISAQTFVILESIWRPSASPKLLENPRGAPFAAKMATRLCKSPPGVSFGTEAGTPLNIFAANLDSEAERHIRFHARADLGPCLQLSLARPILFTKMCGR